MEIIFILLGLSLLMAVIFLLVFLVNLKSGQYEDVHSPAIRILFDDLKKEIKTDNEANGN
jgi:cbb3-type cytochrome oxidase maturation protein